MLSAFQRILSGRKPPSASEEDRCLDLIQHWQSSPDDPIRLISPQDLFKHPDFSHQLHDIARAFGEERKDFDRLLLPLIYSAVDFVQLFPASRFNHHHRIGGLAIHLLDVCIRMLNSAKDFTPYYPPTGILKNSEQKQFAIDGRIFLTALALAHDLPKIHTNMRILIHPENEPSNAVVYDPSPHVGPYSHTPREFAKHVFPHDYSSACYRVGWRSGRLRRSHDEAVGASVLALLARARVRIDPRVPQLYLPPGSSSHVSPPSRPKSQSLFYERSIAPLLNTCDSHSALEYFNALQEELPVDAAHEGLIFALDHAARSGLFDTADHLNQCLWFSMDLSAQLLRGLPDSEELMAIATSLKHPDAFLQLLRSLQRDQCLPFEPESDGRYHLHNGEKGLFIVPSITAALFGIGHISKRSSDVSSGSDSPSLSSMFPSSDEHESLSSSSIDVSSLGAAIEPPPIEDLPSPKSSDAQTELLPEEPSRSTPKSIPEDFLVVAVFANYAESLTEGDLQRPDSHLSVEDGRLIFGIRHMAVVLQELRRLGFSVSDFLSSSEKYCRRQWQLDTTGGLQIRLICSIEYTSAIFDKTSLSDILLISDVYDGPVLDVLSQWPRPPRASANSKSPKPGSQSVPAELPSSSPSSSSTSRATHNPSSSTSGKKVLSSSDFFRFLSSVDHSSDLVSKEGKRLSVSIDLVDSYIVQKSRRGEFINLLQKSSVLLSRSPHFWYFDLTNKDLRKCLNV